jgi:hypothetical protein
MELEDVKKAAPLKLQKTGLKKGIALFHEKTGRARFQNLKDTPGQPGYISKAHRSVRQLISDLMAEDPFDRPTIDRKQFIFQKIE